MSNDVAMRFITSLPTNSLGHASWTDVLTPAQFQKALQHLGAQKGVDILNSPELTTASGRRAEVQIVTVTSVATGLKTSVANGKTNVVYQTEKVPCGPILDLIPKTLADGHSISMEVIPTVTEFLGYETPQRLTTNFDNSLTNRGEFPLPRFRVRQTATSVVLRDGQTLVMGNLPDKLVAMKQDGSLATNSYDNGGAKQLFVFVTASIVDSAGNRIHTNSETSSASK